MGGPSRESYLAAEQRKRERIAALRTRHGVVDIAEWTGAVRVRAFVEERFGAWPMVLHVRLAPAPEVGFVVRIVLAKDSESLRMALPSAVDDVPVELVVRNRS